MAKITKVIKSLLPKDLGSLGNLKEPESAGALVPLEKQEVVPSRREFLKKAGSAVAQTALPRGVLTTLIEKGLEPVAKGKVPISTFKNFLTNSIDFRKAVLDSEFDALLREDMFDELLDKKITSIDDLSDDEINDVFEHVGARAVPLWEEDPFMREAKERGIDPTLLATDTEMGDRVHDILESTGLSVKDFVTERLQGKEVSPEPEEFPENNLLSSFIDRMNKSGYTDEEITEFLEDSLERYE